MALTIDREPAALAAESLSCERGGRLLFVDLAFRLPPGGALLLSGANGSGKTSLLRVLAGLLAPRTGRVLWRGLDTREEPAPWRRALGWLGHDDAVKPQITVAENLSFWRALDAPAGAGDGAEALRSLGLERLSDLPAGLLSAGQRRRLALARLRATRGGCWLLDEPAATLDRESVARLMSMIAAHRDAGGVAVVAGHGEIGLDDANRLELGAR